MTFKDIFAGISSASTATALYGLSSPYIGESVLMNIGAIGLSIFIGYSVSFYIQRQLEEHEKFSMMIIVSLLLSATYTTNSTYITSIIDSDIGNKMHNEEKAILKANNIYQRNLMTLKEGNYEVLLKKELELEKKLDKLKSLDTQYMIEYQDKLEAFRKEYTDTPNSKFRRWWGKIGKVSGCYTIYSKPKRIECVALYRAKNYRENKVLLTSVKSSIDKIKKQLKSLSSIMEQNDNMRNIVHEQVEKKYEDKKIDEIKVKIILFLIGFFFEGILLFELWLRLDKRKKEAKRRMELVNTNKQSIKNEIKIIPFDIIKLYAKNKNNNENPLHNLLVRTTKGKQKYRAIPNALIGAFYYSYIFNVPLQDVTQANIRFANGRDNQNVRETFSIDGETFYALGSTSNVTTYKGKRISPQKVALNYIRKNNISEDISLEMFFYVIEGFLENIDKYI